MRRRVEIARGLVHEPRIFFLDEPTTGLDPGVARRASGRCCSRSRRERDLTILLTTHYMDEADKLCDRIAIVDHGELKALDSPMKLKASIPGKNVARGQLRVDAAGLGATRSRRCRTSRASPATTTCSASRPSNGPATTMALIDAAARGRRARCSRWRSRARRSTTCSCTTPGRALRDALQERDAAGQPVHDAAEAERMHRTWAIVERELRRFRRSPMLIVMSMVFPLVQLVVLGYAFGGNVKHLKVGRRRSGPRRAGGPDPRAGAARRRRRAARSTPSSTPTRAQALDRPAQRPHQRRADDSAGLLAPRARRRTSRASRSSRTTPTTSCRRRWSAPWAACCTAFNQPAPTPRVSPALPRSTSSRCIPYVPYVQYLLPGSIVMSIFMMVMIGGGIIFIDDKARGLHEGYLVTPITQARADRRLQHLGDDQGGAGRHRRS